MSYFNLNRRFVERESYDENELLVSEVSGKRVDWSKVLEERACVVVAPANFGKTTEMKHQAKRLRDSSEAAAFIALRRLADLRTLKKALEGADRDSYLAWKSSSTGTLTLFVDSLDEAAAGKAENIDYLIEEILGELSWANDRIKWVISTRPATLTAQVFSRLSELLVLPASKKRTATAPSSTLDDTVDSSTASDHTSEAKKLRLFSMTQLNASQAKAYLMGRYPQLQAERLVRLAGERGLAGFTRSPGGLDIIASIDLLSNPPESLTEVFTRVVRAVHVLRGADRRFEDVGSPLPALLESAAGKLASASLVCQLLNIEMPEAKLETPKGALSARLIATPMLSERAVEQLLGSHMFIDSGFHQVKMYPDELLPFLAAQRLAGLVESTDQALRLLQNFTWSSPSGEQGVQREYLPLMGWLATLNPHCRAVILSCDPQALAFFGDLRNSSVPLADAKSALKESFRRLVEQGDHPGRSMFSLTSENFWQAGPKRLESAISELYDTYEEHHWARDVLMDIATTSRLDVLRARILRRHGGKYVRLLADGADVRYLLDLGQAVDLAGLAGAVKTNEAARKSVVALLLGRLGWEYLTPHEVADLIYRQFRLGRDSFSVGYVLDSGGLLAAATHTQLYQLSKGLVVRVARLRRHTDSHGGRTARLGSDYIELTIGVVATLVERSNEVSAPRVARLCMVLVRILSGAQFLSVDSAHLRTALDGNAQVRRALLGMMARSALNDRELFTAVLGYSSVCTYQDSDVEHVNHPRLTQLYATYLAQKSTKPAHAKSSKLPKSKGDGLRIGSKARRDLTKLLPILSDGTATNALSWVAAWLLQTNPNSRYGEVAIEVLEREAGKKIANAVRKGLSHVWRSRAPLFDEAQINSTYHITAAGLQGLNLELGQGINPPDLSEPEIRRALRYGTFEINGYPKWFWPLVEAHPTIATSELSNIAEEAANGPVSREHAEDLLASMMQAPTAIFETLIPIAWSYLVNAKPSRPYVAERILEAVMVLPNLVPRAEFERIALSKMKSSFMSPVTEPPEATQLPLREDAVMWATHWLTNYPASFCRAVSKWGPRDPTAVKAFITQLAAHFGRDHGGRLVTLARASDEGVVALEQLQLWTMWAIDRTDDVERPEGIVYSPRQRDHAQDLRDRLIEIIASANSQRAYEVLERLRASSTGLREMYIRKTQFEMRERQLARQPLSQTNYDQFEKEFQADVTNSLSFSMAVHADLDAVKYDLERGEHSLRSFFSELDFTRVNRKGDEGEKFGLALEANFQRLLASELNHHARGRYSVSVESHTAEGKRRDVLCSRNDWRASIELKMSERWTVNDYVVALERQLVGQYMRHNKATTGFLVLVLQTKNRTWTNPAGGKKIGFEEVLSILSAKAQELESKDRSRYLRVIGIDATAPGDFRKEGRLRHTKR